MNKAFTVIEVMIVVVIIGFLAAMIIPAVQKVRETSIMKAAAAQNISIEEYKYRNGHMNDQEKRIYRRKKESGAFDIKSEPHTETIETIVINGQKYQLIKVR